MSGLRLAKFVPIDKSSVPPLKFELCFLVTNPAQACFLGSSMLRGGQTMIIGDRLRALREEKKFSQGEIEKRSGLLRCYVSRVEHGHTVPAVETLEKFARALEIPLYQLFYDGEEPPELLDLPKRKGDPKLFGATGNDARVIEKFRRLLGQTDAKNQNILLHMAQKMARRKAV
jgi:transcriptional regulator with XRE-family HTH domain